MKHTFSPPGGGGGGIAQVKKKYIARYSQQNILLVHET